VRASGYERVSNDWYVEPRWLVDALLDVEAFSGVCWDPACGGGNIPEALKMRGIFCRASDIANRGYGEISVDFLAGAGSADHIISNPPYGIIEAWIEHALACTTGKVAILARLALLEGQKRKAFFARTPLARVWVSSRRASMPPGGVDLPASGGAIAYAWFVWEHGHAGPATLGWV
jgi:hypothetical protein